MTHPGSSRQKVSKAPSRSAVLIAVYALAASVSGLAAGTTGHSIAVVETVSAVLQ